MFGDGYDTAEDAARLDMPPHFARVLAKEISPDARHALVVLGTTEELEPLVVLCHHDGKKWFHVSGSEPGKAWENMNWDENDPLNRGVLWLVERAPSGIREVSVSLRDTVMRVPVASNGYFIFAAWDVPAADVRSVMPTLRHDS